MTKLLYATGNKYKIQSMVERLRGLDVEIISPKDLNINIKVNENGKTVIENAILKAKAYYDITKLPTIAGDTALYVEKFEKQPGLYVHRVDGRELTPEETLAYYIESLNRVGGESEAYYNTGLVIIKDGMVYSKEIKEDMFILTSRKLDKPCKYDALSQIQYDPKIKKYICELTEEDIKKRNGTFDRGCVEFINEVLVREHNRLEGSNYDEREEL